MSFGEFFTAKSIHLSIKGNGLPKNIKRGLNESRVQGSSTNGRYPIFIERFKEYPCCSNLFAFKWKRHKLFRMEATSTLVGFHADPKSWSNWKLKMLSFLEGGKPSKNPEKNPWSKARTLRNTLATKIMDKTSWDTPRKRPVSLNAWVFQSPIFTFRPPLPFQCCNHVAVSVNWAYFKIEKGESRLSYRQKRRFLKLRKDADRKRLLCSNVSTLLSLIEGKNQ